MEDGGYVVHVGVALLVSRAERENKVQPELLETFLTMSSYMSRRAMAYATIDLV